MPSDKLKELIEKGKAAQNAGKLTQFVNQLPIYQKDLAGVISSSEFDNFLVGIKHPSTREPGYKTTRFMQYIREQVANERAIGGGGGGGSGGSAGGAGGC